MGFSSICKAAADNCAAPSSWATEKKSPRKIAVFLKDPKSNSNFRPISGKVGGSKLIKYLDTGLDFIDNCLFG